MSKRTTTLFITASLAMVLIITLFAAGCTDTSKNTATTPVPTATAVTTQKVVATSTSVPVVVTTPAAPAQKQSITISGSTTVLPIVQKAADQYMASHPEADIQVAGGGSGVGIQAIGAKTVDIGMSSREVTEAEMAKYPSFVVTTVAQDAIALVVNPSNTIPYITLDQAKNIYLGKITKWNQITGADVPNTNNQIVVIGRDSASGTRSYFDETVLLKATPTNKMLEKNSNGAVAQTVAQTPGAIGYVSIGFVTPDIKPLPIWYNYQKIITPSIATVKDKTYPVSRSLYVITNGQPTGLTKGFIDYILSPAGQKIVEDEGYVKITS
ncbi:MAG: phosphate ABC transporter substrate-binding protein [Methanoregula sp.]|jgi:phosphate transport system substrate-binding protein